MIDAIKRGSSLDPNLFLAKAGDRGATCEYGKDQVVFLQGDPADSVFYIRKGHVKIGFHSQHGKKATIAILGAGDIFGEECLIGKPQRTTTITAMTDCTLERVEKAAMAGLLQRQSKFSQAFIAYALARKLQTEQDLLDQCLNPIEKRLARRLLLMAAAGKAGEPKPIAMKVTQETLAEMIGTTQARVSFFMNKFRRLRFIEYNGTLTIRSSLLNTVLED